MKRETIRRHHLSRIQKMKGSKIPMIQDIYPHKLHNEYNPSARVQESSPILNISNGKVLVHTEQFDNRIVAVPLKKELPEELEYTYLFKVDDREYFLWNEELSEDSIPEGYSYIEKEVYVKKARVLVRKSLQLRQRSICQIGTEIPAFAEDAARRWCLMIRNVQ